MSFILDSKSRRVIIGIQNLDKLTKQGMANAMKDIASLLVKDAKAKIRSSEGKTGHLYRLGTKRRPLLHRASAPGEYPANLSGMLANSIDVQITGERELRFGDKQESRPDSRSPAKLRRLKRIMNYGKALEEGRPDRKSGPLEARPHLLPTLKSNQKNIQTYINERINRSVRKGVGA